MRFSELIGQEKVSRQLIDMVQSNRLSHALLFLAQEGSGGLPMALAFSQYLVCEAVQKASRQDDSPSLFGETPSNKGTTELPNDSCGTCSACLKSGKMVHPDIHYSFPVITRKDSSSQVVSSDWITEFREFAGNMPYGNTFDWLQFINAENKQGNITAAECNDIIRKLSIKSFESGYKILVMWMPEYLGKEGNKLLKLIEEPPANTLFILVAENESMILQTILSRTQLVKIPRIPVQDMEGALTSKAGLDASRARQIAVLSEGNYREALQLLNHASEDWLALFRDWMNAILKNGPVSQVRWIEEISKLGREKQKQFLRYCNHMLHLAIRASILKGSLDNLPGSEADFAVRLNKFTAVSQQEAMIQEFEKAAYYIERNANSKMLFHALTIRVSHIIADKSLILIA